VSIKPRDNMALTRTEEKAVRSTIWRDFGYVIKMMSGAKKCPFSSRMRHCRNLLPRQLVQRNSLRGYSNIEGILKRLHLENTAPAKSQISKITRSSASLRRMYELSKLVHRLDATLVRTQLFPLHVTSRIKCSFSNRVELSEDTAARVSVHRKPQGWKEAVTAGRW